MPKTRDKHKVNRFVKEYIQELNGNKAMKKISPNLEGVALAVKTHRWLSDDEIQQKIRTELEKFDNTIVNKDYVLMNLYKLINDKKITPNSKINALSVLSKCLNLSKENQIHLTNIIGEAKLKDLIAKRVKT